MFQRHLITSTGETAPSQLGRLNKGSGQQGRWSLWPLLQGLLLLVLLLGSQFALATAPVVSVSAPASNTKFIAPATITLSANATNDATATIKKVDFYRGTTLIGTDTTAPYSVTWSNAAAGSYNITAKATNSLNQVKTSTAVAVIVNNLPTITLTAPTNNSSVAGKATVNLTATASDTGGSIAKVEFFNGSTLLGTDTTSPYSYSWANVIPGTYSITAKATDNLGDTKTTNVTTWTVTNPLTTSLSAPANNSIATAGSAITVSANATTSKSGTTISKVEFYQGSTLIGSDTSSPYSISWTGAAIGAYSLTSKVTDSQGLTKTSNPISIQVKGSAPTVSLLTPANNASYTAPATISLTSNASANGSGNNITKVEYYQGTTLIGTATAAPYTASWTNAPVGTYSITAKATDIQGLSTTSAARTVKVNAPPTISLTTPVNNSKLSAPANISLSATAAALGSGNSISKVEYYQGTTLIGTATTAPYAATWTNAPAGSYSITAKATDNNGLSQTSAAANVQVNNLPTVAISTPANNASFIAPGTINFSATATADGAGNSISKVEYYQGTTLIGSATSAPYSYSWTNVVEGNYSVTAKATDSTGGVQTSSPIAIAVNSLPTVSLTSPANNSSVIAPNDVSLSADASAQGAGNSVVKVEFFQGTTLIATATNAPYQSTWANPPVGDYSITAKVTDSLGNTQTTAPSSVKVQGLPVVTLTAPTNNASFVSPSSVTLTADANAQGNGVTVSQVEFYQGTSLLGTVNTAPYTLNWSTPAVGDYSITAKVTDSNGLTQTSNAAIIKVRALPTLSLTSPINNATLVAPATVQLSANASANGVGASISQVEFYQGSTLIATVTAPPYDFTWSNVSAGSYSVSAKATDSNGLSQTTTATTIQVNQLPSISVTSPTANAQFVAPTSITLTSNPVAFGAGVSITKVEYFQDGNLIATATAAPFSATWSNVNAGSYNITAVVTDSNQNTMSSAPVAITVINNSAPTVSLTANPSQGTAPATIVVNVTATDTDGSVAKVELFNGSTLLTTLTTAPYTYLWENLGAGSYSLSAKATDNLGAVTSSSDVPVTVNAHVAKIYDIHADHLGTPRMVTDANGNPVWEWIGTPFGESLPNQNPGNTGAQNDFVMNLRFPGQVFDRETGLHYNYFRDYDPGTGRYVQSDPIGLEGGINTFGYVDGNPNSYVDPTGEFFFIPILFKVAIGASIELAMQGYRNYKNGCDWTNWRNYDWGDVGVAGGIGGVAPGLIGAGKTAWRSAGAISNLSKQAGNTANRAQKISNRIASHKTTIQDNVGAQVTAMAGAYLTKKSNGDDCECRK